MTKGHRYIVSACLAGVFCRYNGECQTCEPILDLIRQGQALPICPEQLGGLETPRPPCERLGDQVVNIEGKNLTQEFWRGAQEGLRLARLAGCNQAILKSGSPSCGCGSIYDGTFSSNQIEGNGVFAQLLLDNGIKVITELDLEPQDR